jgi:hypothetical protein
MRRWERRQVGELPPDADVRWLHTSELEVPFGYWKAALNERRDVFLGYSSLSQNAAEAIKRSGGPGRRHLRLAARQDDYQADRTDLGRIHRRDLRPGRHARRRLAQPLGRRLVGFVEVAKESSRNNMVGAGGEGAEVATLSGFCA